MGQRLLNKTPQAYAHSTYREGTLIHADVVIVGGGIVGLSTARTLLNRGVSSVLVLEKESELGRHASGRNSGVIHAGLYYPPGSLKARCCIDGAARLKEYAAEKHIPCLPVGKVIVARSPDELPRLEALAERARANRVPIEKWTPSQLAAHEPEARTVDWALYSPGTAVIDPKEVLFHLAKDVQADRLGDLRLGEPVLRIDPKARRLRTPHLDVTYGHLINTAGLFADRIARQMGVGASYLLLPFRGRYFTISPPFDSRIHGLIYPVPDPRLPFLGVHFTRSASGAVTIGPTAEPAWGREHYAGWAGLRAAESLVTASALVRMALSNRNGIVRHVIEEMSKRLPGGMWRAARELVPALRPEHVRPSSKVGIRAQLVDRRTLVFVHDFVIESADHSTHVLNAVSPAFTAAFAFADLVADRVLAR